MFLPIIFPWILNNIHLTKNWTWSNFQIGETIKGKENKNDQNGVALKHKIMIAKRPVHLIPQKLF